MLYQPVVVILYTFYLLIEIPRIDSLEYLREGKNSLFLGAA